MSRNSNPRVIAARAEVEACDRSVERLALACSRPGRFVTPEIAAADERREAELLARAERADRELRAALAACDACGDAPAVADGYCGACSAELTAHYDATREAHAMSTDDDGARFGFGDAEGENYIAGIRS